MAKDNKKTLYGKTIKCPYCNKLIEAKHTKVVIEKTIRGKYEEDIEASKSEQKQL